MENLSPIGSLVEQIAKNIVDAPNGVVVREIIGEQVTVIELRTGPGDLGKVIGRQGRIANAVRVLLGAAGMKLHRRFTLEVLE